MNNDIDESDYKNIAHSLGFEMDYYESELSFGNIIIVLLGDYLMIRIIQDRKYVFCEVRSSIVSDFEEWVDYETILRMIGIKIKLQHDDFDLMVRNVMNEKNMDALTELKSLVNDKDQYLKISHQAISYQRDHSPFRRLNND